MTIFTTLDQLQALRIPEIRRLFLEVMQDIVDQSIINEMVLAIEDNDFERLFKATGFTPAALSRILDRIEDTYRDSAETTVSTWPKRIILPSGGQVIFRFNMRNEKVEQDLRIKSSNFITRINDEVRENVRIILERGMIKGANPRTTALDIVGRIDPVTKKRAGGIIGLTNNQTKWVESSERYIKTLDKKYFTLALRDKRFDGIVKKSIKSGKSLSSSDVTRIVSAYKKNALRYRGEAIARTETIQSLNRGSFMAHVQAVEEGIIENNRITKEWDDTGDRNTRHSHLSLGLKYDKGKGIDINEPFITDRGERMMTPGDTSLGVDASEIVHCRCKARYFVDWLRE